MENSKILYKIKTLEKTVFRNFIFTGECFPNNAPTVTQMQIIEYILDNSNHEIYQRDLEKILKLKRATVSGVLQTMEKNDLITRVVDENDTRSKKVILNEKTKNIFFEKMERVKQLESMIVKGISKKDLKVFSKVLDEMILNMEKIVK